MTNEPPVCDWCGEEKEYIEGYKLAGEPSGWFCTTTDCGKD